MHKVTNGEYLENISSLFVVKNNNNYNLRNNNIDYKLEKPKTNFLNQLFRCKNLERITSRTEKQLLVIKRI
jgi:hypothetical protein